MAEIISYLAWRECSGLDPADLGGVHLREAEALCSEVFQRGPDQVEFLVVDDKKSVVEGFVVADGELRHGHNVTPSPTGGCVPLLSPDGTSPQALS